METRDTDTNENFLDILYNNAIQAENCLVPASDFLIETSERRFRCSKCGRLSELLNNTESSKSLLRLTKTYYAAISSKGGWVLVNLFDAIQSA